MFFHGTYHFHLRSSIQYRYIISYFITNFMMPTTKKRCDNKGSAIPYPCISCNREVRPRQEALECEQCTRWQHRICGTGITQTQYRTAIKTNAEIKWKCKGCTSILTSVTPSTPTKSQVPLFTYSPLHVPPPPGFGFPATISPVPVPVTNFTISPVPVPVPVPVPASPTI